ncbi:TPA: hypothetical protein ACTXXA_002326 [Legionella anisa]
MQKKIQLREITPNDIINQITTTGAAIDPLILLKEQNLDRTILLNAFNLAIDKGELKVIKILSTLLIP